MIVKVLVDIVDAYTLSDEQVKYCMKHLFSGKKVPPVNEDVMINFRCGIGDIMTTIIEGER